MDGVFFLHQAGFDRVADRRMRDRLQLQFAALAGEQDRRIADVIRPDRAVLDFDQGQRRGRAGAEFADRLVGGLDAVENCRREARSASPSVAAAAAASCSDF